VFDFLGLKIIVRQVKVDDGVKSVSSLMPCLHATIKFHQTQEGTRRKNLDNHSTHEKRAY
jgi:hypothetical protein